MKVEPPFSGEVLPALASFAASTHVEAVLVARRLVFREHPLALLLACGLLRVRSISTETSVLERRHDVS